MVKRKEIGTEPSEINNLKKLNKPLFTIKLPPKKYPLQRDNKKDLKKDIFESRNVELENVIKSTEAAQFKKISLDDVLPSLHQREFVEKFQKKEIDIHSENGNKTQYTYDAITNNKNFNEYATPRGDYTMDMNTTTSGMGNVGRDQSKKDSRFVKQESYETERERERKERSNW